MSVERQVQYIPCTGAGYLFFKEHVSTIKKVMRPSAYIVELEGEWCCYLTENDFDINPEKVADEMLKASHHTPILYFIHEEKDGWGFLLLQYGKITSALMIAYAQLHSIAEKSVLFDQIDFDRFRLFGLKRADIKKLRNLLRAKHLVNREDMFLMPQKFQKLLGFDMEYVYWGAVRDLPEYFELIAKDNKLCGHNR
ncbi:hypothetical protein LJC55_03170 [Eubacteriales bacterium OttesenSCG-928-N14]|nr:hypothetical protein [Eubacteriales bacterium OttesenSCG-928-N14]